MQQASLFESVTTEAPLTPGSTAQTQQTELSLVGFVLMRSPTLNVLLTATPIRPGSQSLAPDDLSQNSQPTQAATHAEAQITEALTAAKFPSEGSRRIQAIVSQAIKSESANASKADLTYEIQLSFDEQTIADFVRQKIPTAIERTAGFPRQNSQQTEQHPLHPYSYTHNNMQKPTNQHQDSGPQTGEKPQASAPSHITTSHITNSHAANRQPDPEDFVLAWTKELAVASDNSMQATLETQVQQSLLLNQVITRIRHSLDLPAILETTVAQVREFLSADRLVVYQFEQLESVDLSSPSSTKPFTKSHSSTPSSSSGGSSNSSSGGSSGSDSNSLPNSPSHNRPTADINRKDSAIVGRCTHEGHVTYESRISEALPSVLNLSETECFMPSLSIRDRYVMGQPIAVDNVDEKYAHTRCLLDFLHQAQVKSKIIAPIIVQDQLWGLLIAHQCDRLRHWEKTEVLFLQHIAEHLAVAIGQAGLYHQLQQQTVSLESCVVERTQNLHDALLAAESANLTKGEFLSTMSHELRTPLTYIIGMSATLLRWSFGDLSERQRSYLDTINHSGEQLLGIINDILEFAKISSGRSFLDVSEFSLRSLIDGIMEHFRAIADKQGVSLSLSFEATPEQDSFRADAKRLQQIISNLVHNAIKFTPAGGQVTLRIQREDQVGIFQIEDTGIGIPESQKGLLFEKFKQLESPFQRQYSGTGLGLAMTKRLVELHGGSIQVKSAVGEGSVFSVRLPLQSPRRVNSRYQVPSTLPGGHKRVLLLEKQEDSAAIICDLLTADGYEVILQVDANQILTQLESLQPAIFIADFSLLSLEENILKEIQLAVTAIGAKVLALLDQTVPESSHMAHHDTLNKPIDPKKMLKKVRHLTLKAL